MNRKNTFLIILIGLVGATIVFFFSSGKDNSLDGILVGIVTILSSVAFALLRSRQKKQSQ